MVIYLFRFYRLWYTALTLHHIHHDQFFSCAALFVSGIVLNLGALEHANVETLIVARSCLPLATSILDYFFLGRQVFCLDLVRQLTANSCRDFMRFFQLPSWRSLASLIIIATGCAAYVATDKQFMVEVNVDVCSVFLLQQADDFEFMTPEGNRWLLASILLVLNNSSRHDRRKAYQRLRETHPIIPGSKCRRALHNCSHLNFLCVPSRCFIPTRWPLYPSLSSPPPR